MAVTDWQPETGSDCEKVFFFIDFFRPLAPPDIFWRFSSETLFTKKISLQNFRLGDFLFSWFFTLEFFSPDFSDHFQIWNFFFSRIPSRFWFVIIFDPFLNFFFKSGNWPRIFSVIKRIFPPKSRLLINFQTRGEFSVPQFSLSRILFKSSKTF